MDTSVWIDLLRGHASAQADRLAELITDEAPIAITDIVYTELLQGVPDDLAARRLDDHLQVFPILRLEALRDFALAAELFRIARRAGKTIGKTNDCLIAAACVRAGAPILHSDGDFDRLAECTPLTVFG